MAFTQADLDNINKIIASALAEIQSSDGKRSRYQPMDELLRAKAEIEADLSKSGGAQIVRQIRPVIRSGW